MLGRFLELSLPTPDIRKSLDFYARLGFSQAAVGEVRSHPYAVLTDGRLCLGLHERAQFVQSMTFVKPGLLAHLTAFEKLGMKFEFRRLGNDVFNEVGWLDPAGHMIRLVEARTFSPSKRREIDRSLCGYFTELGLPTGDAAAGKTYWERLGFVGMDEPDASFPHVACTSDTVDIGLYSRSQLRGPTLIFEVDDFSTTLAGLAARGVEPGRPTAHADGPGALFHAPEGTPILLVQSGIPQSAP